MMGDEISATKYLQVARSTVYGSVFFFCCLGIYDLDLDCFG